MMEKVSGTDVIASTWTLYILSGVFVGLRLWCKLWHGRGQTLGVTIDDIVLVFAWVSEKFDIP